jgi:large subunit ribosomal protein L7/L12
VLLLTTIPDNNMADINKIKEELNKLTILEVSELVKALEEEWGVSAAAPVAMGAFPMGGPAAEAAPAEEEKTEFNVELASIGENKIAVIKEVRAAVPGLGLGDAKKLVESAPAVIREAVPKEEAEEIKKKIEAAGAKVNLK